MNWTRLKNMQCPRCNRVLDRNKDLTGYKCPCGFFVLNGKLEAIVNKIYSKSKRNINEVEDNLERLNNL